jgi:hypothetical protein
MPLGEAIKDISAVLLEKLTAIARKYHCRIIAAHSFLPEERMQHKIEHDKCVPF